jgi:tRNA pseudouridine55 synthase
MELPLNGVLVADKPEGPTSHDIVLQIRRALRAKVGHAGTLDPAASGVLPLLIGQATRLMRFFRSSDKEYVAAISMGAETDTYDAQGAVTRKSEPPHLDRDQAERILDRFRGSVAQIPPMYSAVRVAGERLYKAARRQEIRTRPYRSVEFHRLELLELRRDEWLLHVHCSAGAYIRTLAFDIGRAAGCGAHLRELRRTRSGQFTLENAAAPEPLAANWRRYLVPMEKLLPHLPRINFDESDATRISHGNEVATSSELIGTCRVFVSGRLLAIGECRNGKVHPFLVLSESGG